ncbi:ABC transporter ATP-binding protein [Streptomyces prunicolor]
MVRPLDMMARRSERWLTILKLLRHVPPVPLALSVLLNVLLGLLPIAFVVVMSVLLQRVAETADGDSAAWSTLMGLLLAAGTVFGAQQSLAPFQEAAAEVVMRHVDGRCRGELMSAVLTEAPSTALDDQRLLDRLEVAREAFDRTTASPGDAAAGAVALVARYIQLIGAVVLVAIALSVQAALAIGLAATVIRFGQRGALGTFSDYYDRLAPEKRKMTYTRRLASGTHAAKEIRLLGLHDWLLGRYRGEHLTFMSALWRGRRRVMGRPYLLLSAVGLTGAVIALAILAIDAAHGDLSLLELSIAAQAVLILVRFGAYFPESDVQTQYGSIAYQALLGFRDGARGLPAPAPGQALVADGLPRRSIRFEDVGFRYRPQDRAVLDGLDLELPAGTSTAVVGLNGAGKTTLVKLLTRLHDPTGGRITVDGHDLADITPEEWHKRLAVIFQEYIRYELSAADNIALGDPRTVPDEEALMAAARRAGADGAIRSLPGGLDTVLNRRYRGGRDLSGGQWQRVALARALHAVHGGASVMILDEPTAQLDVRAEVEFFDRFLDITRGLTTVVISHRFSTVRRADQIVVLDKGRVAERGTHDQLVAADGLYARLFRLQAERFGDEADTSAPEPVTDVVS